MNLDLQETDVVVIGGGPAGLAAAIAMRLKGLRVLVIDHARPPVDKVCGEGLMPDAVDALDRLGVKLPPCQSVSFRGIRFIAGRHSAEALFPDNCGVAIRRTALHELLTRRAGGAGVSMCWGTTARGIESEGVNAGGRVIRCRWIVGADGLNSRVRRWAGMDHPRLERIRFGRRRHFELTPWTDLVEVYWGEDYQIVITPVTAHLVSAALLSKNPRLRLEDAISRVPALWRRLRNTLPATREMGSVTGLRVMREVIRGRCALVGDASGSVDAITGEGLGLAFRQAAVLADALSRGCPAQYAAAHRDIVTSTVLMSKLLLAMGEHAFLRERVPRLFAAKPRVFSELLSAHVGADSAPVLDARRLFRLGWQVLAG